MVSLTLHFDIDGVICTDVHNGNYEKAVPLTYAIEIINKLYDKGHWIIINTSRGKITDRNLKILTIKQLAKWGVKYHELLFTKPAANYYIDDKALNVN